jgi:uncharacterized protein
MKRDRTSFLLEWLQLSLRKPLVIRGARQVGKTWLIRDFAELQGKQLIELNFEKRPDFVSLFSSNDPVEILNFIALSQGIKIDPANIILFLDEIQTAPHLLAKLRWFAEDMPELPVIAAGSLLDFALAQHEFNMPVGRISYMYLGPLSFEEFLDAVGQDELRVYLQSYECHSHIPEAIHLQLMKHIKEFLIIGGMPAAVSTWITKKNPESVSQIHFDLLATYRDDFAKYNGRIKIDYLEDVMSSICRQLGKKFVYKHVNPDVSSAPIKQALDLLCKARVSHRVAATSANGLPLGAEISDKFSKAIMLDCGLCSASLGLTLHQLQSVSEIAMINQGGMSEQLVGQLLHGMIPPYVPPSLYYWHRERKGSEAEVDYVIQHESEVIPIEVKSGTTGTLKSLHQFMKEKKKRIAVRINSDVPRLGIIEVKDVDGELIEYSLLSIPFYLLEQLHRLIKTI